MTFSYRTILALSCLALSAACSSSSSTPDSTSTGGTSSAGTSGGGTSSTGGSAGTSASGSGGEAAGGSVTSSNPAYVYCTNHDVAGDLQCYGLAVGPVATADVQQMSCMTNYGGTVVASCPTAGLVGCCTQVPMDPEVEECHYSGDASTYMMTCGTGDWFTTPQ